MWRSKRILMLAGVLAVCWCGHVSAQTDVQPVQWQPVDQTVSDLDLRSTSFRRVEQGLSVYGQSGALYHRSGDAGWSVNGQQLNQAYQLRRPGYTAYIDRPEYWSYDQAGERRFNIAQPDGRSGLSNIPPNTVFDLVYRPRTVASPPTPLPTDHSLLVQSYTSTRQDGRYDGRVTHRPPAIAGYQPVIAHRLPEALIKARQARRAEAEAQEQTPPQAEPENAPAE